MTYNVFGGTLNLALSIYVNVVYNMQYRSATDYELVRILSCNAWQHAVDKC